MSVMLGAGSTLSRKRWQILSCGILRMKQAEISERLGYSLSSVKVECMRISRMLGAQNFKHAVAIAVRHDDLMLHEDLRNRNDLYQEMLAKMYLRKS